MSKLIDAYDNATNALRKARAINHMIYRVAEESSQTMQIHEAADAAEDYLVELAKSLKAIYEGATEEVSS